MNKKWEIYTRGEVPFYRINLFNSLRKASLEHNKNNFLKTLYACEGGKTWWAWDKKGLDEWGKFLLNKINGGKKGLAEHCKKHEISCSKAVKAAELIRKRNLLKLTNKELLDLFDYLEKESDSVAGFASIDLDVFDISFEKFLQDSLKNKLAENRIDFNKNKFESIYRYLSAPVYKTFISQEEEAMARVASKKSISNKDIKEIYDKFWWVDLGWENINPRNIDYYIDEIKRYSQKNNLNKIISEINGRSEVVKGKRKEIIKKYNLGREISRLLGVFDKFVYFHDLRKETQMRVVYSFDLLLKEVSKRFDIKENNREWYSHKEIKDILRGKKVNEREIERRKESILVLVEKDGIKILSGKEATKKREKELKQSIESVSEVKGMGVTKGKVVAKVRVCRGIDDARDKIKKGDILVVGMTLPDYVSIMKIASAIVTDEGGITCHAAIVARELKKPCVIGTKIATQILKDGDEVEVDANVGIVKILKKS